MSLARGKLLQIFRIPIYQVRNASHGNWNKDYQPGFTLPTTPEEKAAVAKKYNMLPEEYEPHTEMYKDGNAPGDYPKLPDIAEVRKDIYYPYDLPYMRMNFNEPRSLNMLYWTAEKCDPNYKETLRWNQWLMLAAMLAPVALMTLLSYSDLKFFPPVAKRHLLNDGRKHYSYD